MGGAIVSLLRHKLFRRFHFCSDDVLYEMLKEVCVCVCVYIIIISCINFCFTRVVSERI